MGQLYIYIYKYFIRKYMVIGYGVKIPSFIIFERIDLSSINVSNYYNFLCTSVY
jgi:hypothetical protein